MSDTDRVAAVLWKDWDPIGMRQIGGPDDEYDSYVEGVVALLKTDASERAIAEYLYTIEVERMGLPARKIDAERAAKVLMALGIR